MADIFPVQIEVETYRRKRIRIQGPPMEVTSVIDRIHSIFLETHKNEFQKMQRKWIANLTNWEYEDGKKFERYPDRINYIINTANDGINSYAEWDKEDGKYRLNFRTSVEEFTCITPKRKVRKVTKEIEVPANWRTMRDFEKFIKIRLNASDQEYKDVKKTFLSTAQTTVNRIVKIERIQNKLLYREYSVRKAAMDAANPGIQNEMTLWHGPSADAVKIINETGFNRSYCGRNATVYGRGVYFTKNFSYSAQNPYSPPDAKGNKHVYQCKVLTGEYAVGNQRMIWPPYKTGAAAKNYDSTVDNANTPTMFVIYYDTQAYPEYLIYFK